MDSSYIAIWLPIFIVIVLILPQQAAERTAVARLISRKKEGRIAMTNELVKKYIGKHCRITTGSMGINVTGRITEVNENWIEIETKKGKEIVNLDFIQNISIKE